MFASLVPGKFIPVQFSAYMRIRRTIIMGQIQIDIEATSCTVEDGDNAQSQGLSVLTTGSTRE
jgi:hypothetical protein